MKYVPGDPQNETLSSLDRSFFFDIDQTSILFNKENTKVLQPGSNYLHVSSEWDIKLKKQIKG